MLPDNLKYSSLTEEITTIVGLVCILAGIMSLSNNFYFWGITSILTGLAILAYGLPLMEKFNARANKRKHRKTRS